MPISNVENLSSDFGTLLLQGVDRQTGLIDRLASAIEDTRHPFYMDHSLREHTLCDTERAEPLG